MDLLIEYLPLCWFKNHPWQLTGSLPFLKKNAIFGGLLKFLMLANMIPVHEAFFAVLINIGLILGFVAAMLSLNRTMHNHTQMVSALLFCENVVLIFCVPVVAWLTVTYDWLSYTAFVGVIFWNFALIAYIMKRVLAIDVFASMVIAFLYFVSTYGVAYSFTLLF